MQIAVWNFRCTFIGSVYYVSFDLSLIIRQSALLGISFINDVTTYFLKSITLSSPHKNVLSVQEKFRGNYVASFTTQRF